MSMDYEPTEPKYIPIVFAIIVTIVLILFITLGLIFYFKAELNQQELRNEAMYGNSMDLQELRQWESSVLNSKNNDKINIDEAIYITTRRYSK